MCAHIKAKCRRIHADRNLGGLEGVVVRVVRRPQGSTSSASQQDNSLKLNPTPRDQQQHLRGANRYPAARSGPAAVEPQQNPSQAILPRYFLTAHVEGNPRTPCAPMHGATPPTPLPRRLQQRCKEPELIYATLILRFHF